MEMPRLHGPHALSAILPDTTIPINGEKLVLQAGMRMSPLVRINVQIVVFSQTPFAITQPVSEDVKVNSSPILMNTVRKLAACASRHNVHEFDVVE